MSKKFLLLIIFVLVLALNVTALASYAVVDDFDSYGNTTELRAVWHDYWADPSPYNGGEVFVETDPNFTRDGNSMEFRYANSFGKGKYYGGSWANAETADLGTGSNWTAYGVKALTLYFYGDFNNVTEADDQMYVALEDTDANTGVVENPDVHEIHEEIWHEWNIDLAEFDSCGVDLTEVNKIQIGFGGTDWTGQSYPGGEGTVYFEDIRLYPPRCLPEYVISSFNDDCVADYCDLNILLRDWLMTGGIGPPPAPREDATVWYRLDDGPGSTLVTNSGSYGGVYDIPISSPNGPNEPNWTTDAGLVPDACEPNYAMVFDGVDDFLTIPPLYLHTNTMTITAWIKRNGEQAGGYTGIVFNRDGGDTAGLSFGSTGPPLFPNNNELAYNWNDDPNAWAFNSGLDIPDANWVFVAVAVEPTQATLYLAEANDSPPYDYYLRKATNTIFHGIEKFTGVTRIGSDELSDNRYFDGRIDDVRIYDYTLPEHEIAYLASVPEAYISLETWPTDINGDDVVNFKDYTIMADNWLKEFLWPPE